MNQKRFLAPLSVVALAATMLSFSHTAFGQDQGPDEDRLPDVRTVEDAAEKDLGPKRRGAAKFRPQARNEVMVFLQPGVDAESYATDHGLRVIRPMRGMQNSYLMQTATPAHAQSVPQELARDPRTLDSFTNYETGFQKFGFVPNDPFFFVNSSWSGQWHLWNQFQGSIDVRIQGAWDKNYTGSGVILGVVDDSVEISHPDLQPNASTADSWDFGQNDSNPGPVHAGDEHGIAVAGVAVARGGNGIGVTGAAPLAKLAGLRVDFVNQTSQMFVDATLFHSTTASGNKNIKIKNHSYGYPYPYIPTAAEAAAISESSDSGTVHVFAAGNSRGGSGQDSNKQQMQNQPKAIAVAALGIDGKFSYYSSFGANVFVTAPSSDSVGILTTDRTGSYGYNGMTNVDYTNQFGGTSSAAPLVAGVLAVAKQANPAMNVRFAKHMLAATSDLVDSGDTTESGNRWITNAAGKKFNQNYGFGLINATRLVDQITQFSGVTPSSGFSTATTTVNATLPDNSSTGVTKTFSVSGKTGRLEDISVQLVATHPFRGDLEAYLTSPSGTKSRLMMRSSGDDDANLNWTFTTNAFWGELPNGTWKLTLADRKAADTGTWNSYKVSFRLGNLVPKGTDGSVYVTQTVPTSMIAGQTYTVKVSMQNNGNTTWKFPYWQLGARNPSDTLRWGKTRVDLGTADSIAPGQTKNFSFSVYAPSAAGTHNMQWGMVRMGTLEFGPSSTNVPVSVAVKSNAARYLSQSVPSTVKAGSTFTATVKFRNVGTNTWTKAAGYKLSSQEPYNNTTWGFSRVDMLTGDSVSPGQDKTFTFTATAPSTPGTYKFRWRMVHTGVEVFGDFSTLKNIVVTQ